MALSRETLFKIAVALVIVGILYMIVLQSRKVGNMGRGGGGPIGAEPYDIYEDDDEEGFEDEDGSESDEEGFETDSSDDSSDSDEEGFDTDSSDSDEEEFDSSDDEFETEEGYAAVDAPRSLLE